MMFCSFQTQLCYISLFKVVITCIFCYFGSFYTQILQKIDYSSDERPMNHEKLFFAFVFLQMGVVHQWRHHRFLKIHFKVIYYHWIQHKLKFVTQNIRIWFISLIFNWHHLWITPRYLNSSQIFQIFQKFPKTLSNL